MDALAHDRPNAGSSRLGLSVLFLAPSAVALIASTMLAQHARYPVSALWFTYEVSMYAGCVGIIILAVMMVLEFARSKVTATVRWLLAICAAVGVFLLWLAGHLYRSPWAPTT